MEKLCVFSEVGTEFLNTGQCAIKGMYEAWAGGLKCKQACPNKLIV
jgi:hypothetical protein